MNSSKPITKVQEASIPDAMAQEMPSETIESLVPFIGFLGETEQSLLRYLSNPTQSSVNAFLARFLEERVNPEAFAIDAPTPVASLTFDLAIDVDNRYSNTSPSDVIHRALVTHRDNLVHDMLVNICSGDYYSAFTNQRDIEDVNHTLETFVEGLAILANKNFWANEVQTSNDSEEVEDVKAENQKRFESFMVKLGLAPMPNLA